jgi:hypothetical protein
MLQSSDLAKEQYHFHFRPRVLPNLALYLTFFLFGINLSECCKNVTSKKKIVELFLFCCALT